MTDDWWWWNDLIWSDKTKQTKPNPPVLLRRDWASSGAVPATESHGWVDIISSYYYIMATLQWNAQQEIHKTLLGYKVGISTHVRWTVGKLVFLFVDLTANSSLSPSPCNARWTTHYKHLIYFLWYFLCSGLRRLTYTCIWLDMDTALLHCDSVTLKQQVSVTKVHQKSKVLRIQT